MFGRRKTPRKPSSCTQRRDSVTAPAVLPQILHILRIASPRSAIRTDHAEVSHRIRGPVGRLVLELWLNIALPQVGRFDDMHVTVHDFASLLHRMPPS